MILFGKRSLSLMHGMKVGFPIYLATYEADFIEDDAFRQDIANLSTGIAWYRKHFKIPGQDLGQKAFLEFEGIRHGGEFYLNNEFLGRSENGVMAFGFDITKSLTTGENVLAARIDNAWNYKEKATNAGYQWNDKNFYANYGGINKNVYLHMTDRLYQTLPLYSNLRTTGVYVYARNFDIRAKSATITAETEIRNEYPTPKTFGFSVVLEDLNGKSIKTFKETSFTLAANETKVIRASDVVNNLEFWSWGYGYLYNVLTILNINGAPIDIVRTRTGFRKTDFSHGMFKLNERTLHLKGYAQRTTNEWPTIGSAVPAWLSDFSNNLMVESNANLVRWMHVTPWKQDVESCDRVGLMQAMPAGDSEKDVTDRRWEQRLELMRDAIIYNRNNPSIIFYESGNKGVSEEHQKQMIALRNKFDPFGGRASGSREMLNSNVAEFGGEMLYINKGTRIPFWAMEYSRDEALRKYWDEFSPPFHKDGDGPPYKNENGSSYNRNQDSHAIENVVRWFDYWEARPGTGKRVNAGGVNIIFSDSNTHHRGTENYRRSGEVDALRLPKDGFYAHQVMWDGWVDVERSRTHIVGHWNYGHSTTKNVYVISAADKVELLLNGKSIGMGKQSSRFLFTFENVRWQPGELKAIGLDSMGERTTEDSKKTAGEPTAIRLKTHVSPNGFRADGHDIAMVDIEVIDSQGNRCPTNLDMIDLNLSGEAVWRGGLAQGPQNYILSKSLPVENGINRILLRSTAKPGNIIVNARSGKLKPASIELKTRPFTESSGLSDELPDENLPGNLKRGATPTGESFKMQRNPIQIGDVQAGSNQAKAVASFDDDETTQWVSDGKSNTAWIKYDLVEITTINQIVLKLPNWRTRTYPVEISVGGGLVFKGITARSLGYVTLEFKPTSGKTVKIALNGNTSDKDSNTVEIGGTVDSQSSSGKGNTLGIVEIEIYGPL
jgi:beta-galactosidase